MPISSMYLLDNRKHNTDDAKFIKKKIYKEKKKDVSYVLVFARITYVDFALKEIYQKLASVNTCTRVLVMKTLEIRSGFPNGEYGAYPYAIKQTTTGFPECVWKFKEDICKEHEFF